MPAKKQSIALALALALTSTFARADDGASEKQRVLALYQQATKEYNLGRYDAALSLYTQAYELRADPAFLFNIAQCYRMLHKPADAAREYRAYLREAPEAPNRTEVQQRIKDMEEEAARQEASKPPTGTQPPATDATARPRVDLVASSPEQPPSRTWLWITIGAAAAVVIAAVAVGLAFGLSSSNAPSSTLGNYGVLP